MNKADLINKVAEILGSKRVAKSVIDCINSTITGALRNQEKVTLVGFGTFSVVKRAARRTKNPRTGEVIKIHPKNAPKFIPGKALKEAVR
jgi:DNA-binding protein HU-beta